MRRKKKCNNGSFNLLQFALFRFALISAQNVVTKMYQWEFITFRVVITFRVATQVKRRISQLLAYTLFSNSKA